MTKYAILVEFLEWELDCSQLKLDEFISFIKLENHAAGTLYKQLSKKGIFGVDVFKYQMAIIIEAPRNYLSQIYPTDEVDSYSTELLTILTLIYKGYLGTCRVISSKDNFKTSYSAFLLYENCTFNVESLSPLAAKFNQQAFNILQTVWQNMKKLNYPSYHPRVINAFDFYYFSWNSIHPYQIAINLSVVLETLFSPNSTNELSHQIAYNVAKFNCPTKEERIKTYLYVKKFYSARSKLVHGGDMKPADMNLIVDFFKFISEILLKILSDSALFDTFNDDRIRKKYFEELLFE